MLQIRALVVLLLFLFATPWSQGYDSLPSWLMEDAFDDEYILPFDIDVVSPADVQTAYQLYKNGNYKEAMGFLKKIRNLNLPDGRLDFFIFIIAECNRMLKLKETARQEYIHITTRFPESDKNAPSLYRLIEYAVDDNNFEVVDSLQVIFLKSFQSHPLISAVHYATARSLYIQKKYESAITSLNNISSGSAISNQAQFLTALCLIGLKEYQKAIAHLDLVIQNGKKPELVSEAKTLAGDINYLLKRYDDALKYYSNVPANASRHTYVVIKTAKVFLDMKRYSEAEKLGRDFLKKEKSNDYFFEMATILEQVYSAQKKERDAARVENIIHSQLIDSRILFEVYEERDRLTDIAKILQQMEFEAIRKGDKNLKTFSAEKKKKNESLQKKCTSILNQLNVTTDKTQEVLPHWAERRYISMVKKDMTTYEDSISSLKNEIELEAATVSTTTNQANEKLDSLEQCQKQLISRYDQLEHEYLLVENECFAPDERKGFQQEEMQVRFVDWSFIKYQDRNRDMVSLAQKLSDLSKQAKSDTMHIDSLTKEIEKVRADYEKNVKAISEDRLRLIEHINTMLEVYPKNKYNGQILFRLAELKYDLAGDKFQYALREYEAAISSGKDSSGLEFPEYNLDTVIAIYDDIITNYPLDELADDACFYKALALQKQGLNEEANDALLELTDKYPESEYYTEANMNIGRFYFDHPKIENDQGYKLAEEAYRKVLFFRDHPQYVQALYHLGWCYYMQDRFEEAIAAFKFLVEENKLDFDPSKTDEQQIVNPLLRGEAIDYIAISFDERDKIDDAIKFLQLIGNVDYAAMVLKRMAELREEDLDFGAASSIYKRLLEEYGSSTVAPEASMNLIKMYEARSLPDSAMLQREAFFNLYSTGGVWNEAMKKDSALVQYIDSLSVVMGLYVADAEFRRAESNGSQEAYQSVVTRYKKVVDKYPNNITASEALWNMAAINELKLGDKPTAYANYIKFSRNKLLDQSKREQAALNAIALAQSIIPVDTTGQTGKIDFAAKKMIDAVDNYKTLFPDGNSLVKVLMSQAAIYFNRQIYNKAAEIYTEVIKLSEKNIEATLEATLFLAQCRFGEEKWSEAATLFEKVYSQSGDENQRGIAYKLLLQSEFHSARAVMNSGDFEKAAVAFKSIDDRFPGSEYGDIVLYNAAESYEKLEKWQQAADANIELVKRYPSSKYAPDALFNAALSYEKCDKISKAADAYLAIVDNYSSSDKAKDALFNLGFCYEKLGKMDKMAEANERYSFMYPGEKDVEAMLLRSAAFYARTGMYDKAIVVYKNFIRRFPKTPKAVEALFMIAKCYYDQNDMENALFSFNNAEQQNSNLILDKIEPNNYYAGEAAYYSGLIKRSRFLEVKLEQPADKLKASLKEKSELLNEASKAFQRVMQYQSERMFEAAFKVGELYEDLTAAIRDQERPKLDPLQTAVNEKEVMNLCFKIIQNTVIPYAKAMEIASGFDSLSESQRSWVTKAKSSLERNLITAGGFLINAVQAVQNAPIPKEIKEKPLHNFQYQKQVLETLEPLKGEIFSYYKQTLNKIDSLKLGDSVSNVCKDQIAKIAYLKGRDFDELSIEILKSTQNLPSNMNPDEKEDLIFQLEDIIYELQDKSILLYEDALRTIKSLGIESCKWYSNTIESLARLNPDKYGTSFYAKTTFGSDGSWIVRADSVESWNGPKVPMNGWLQASHNKDKRAYAINEKSVPIWGDESWSNLYAIKNAFIGGTPRDGSIFVKSSGRYKLCINNVLILSDTVGYANMVRLDSATGITSLLKGGDNIVSVEMKSENKDQQAFAMQLNVLFDTTQKFQSTIKMPEIAHKKTDHIVVKTVVQDSSSKTVDTGTVAARIKKEKINRKDLIIQIEQYQAKEAASASEIKKERLEIQKLKMKIDEINRKMALIKAKKDKKD
jgi:tetratricopeptide (TPR) repeat protein